MLRPEAQIERDGQGWSIRLPLRHEAVSIDKRIVIGERVVIRRQQVGGVEDVETSLRREHLRVDESGRHAARPRETARHHGTLSESGMDEEPLR